MIIEFYRRLDDVYLTKEAAFLGRCQWEEVPTAGDVVELSLEKSPGEGEKYCRYYSGRVQGERVWKEEVLRFFTEEGEACSPLSKKSVEITLDIFSEGGYPLSRIDTT